MAGKIISVVNRKGGVGKTTVTLGLADTLIAESEKPYRAGKPVVVTVDLDPQASLSRALLYDRFDKHQKRLRESSDERCNFSACMQDFLDSSVSNETKDYITHGVGPIGRHYSMVANNAEAWDVERHILQEFGEEKLKSIVTAILKDLSADFKYVLVDAPPGQTVIAEAAIQASDLVLCPTTPDLLSFWGLQSFDNYLKNLCKNDQGPPARFVFTKFKKKAPSYDAQDRVHEWVNSFAKPNHYITLLKEEGESSAVGGQSINLPFDPKLVARLEGPPSRAKRWPWQRMYTRDTQRAFLRLVSAIKRELGDGKSDATVKRPRAANRNNSDGKRETAQPA